MTSAVFTQPPQDDSNKNVSAFKPGNTDVIRTMLREQQRECQSLHANPIFRELRGDGQKQRKFGKGYIAATDANAPTFDDCQAEGQARMFELIKTTAMKDDKPLKGVWASFGKPYKCLGDPHEPDNTLPKLNRDDISANDSKSQGPKASKKLRGYRGTGDPKRGGGGGANSPMDGTKQDESNGGAIGTDPLDVDIVDVVALNPVLSAIRFVNLDRVEAAFPFQPLRASEHRRVKARAFAGTFVSEKEALEEANNAAKAYGYVAPPARRKLQPLQLAGRVSDGAADPSFFLTQGAELPADLSGSEVAGASTADRTVEVVGEGEGAGVSGAAPAGPVFVPLVDMSLAGAEDVNNPVYRWHNQFIAARQAGRKSLQSALYDRSDQRRRARSSTAMAATLSGGIMADLTSTKGRSQGVYLHGSVPPNPYVKMEQSQLSGAAGTTGQGAGARGGRGGPEPEEARLLTRFYDQLCSVAEAQRASDPLSLLLIQKVKILLEGGTGLGRPLLTAVIAHVADFCRGCGLMRYNKYCLPLLMFIARCVSMPDEDMENMVVEAGLLTVVYNGVLPSKEAPAAAVSHTQRVRSARQGRGTSRAKLAHAISRVNSLNSSLRVDVNGDASSQGALSPSPFSTAAQELPELEGELVESEEITANRTVTFKAELASLKLEDEGGSADVTEVVAV